MADEVPRHYCGYAVVDKSAMAKQSKGPATTNYELTNRSNNYDKQSGSYMRGTSKESYSSGDYSNRGRVGYKDEYKSSSTVKVGDSSGYTEYYKQEKMTRVEYDNNSYGAGSKGNNYDGGNKGSYNYGGGSKGYKSYGGGNKYLE